MVSLRPALVLAGLVAAVPVAWPTAASAQADDAAAVEAAPALVEPPLQWTRWELKGTLIDPPTRLRRLLERDLRTHRALTDAAEDALRVACNRLGYQLVALDKTRTADGEVVATLHLEPIVMVRWVEVDVAQLFDDELRRRLRLRPGAYLPWDPAERQRLLEDEVERIESFLRDEGYFEARATVRVDRDGPYGARVKVAARMGAAYQVGAVKVVNAAQSGGSLALSDPQIRDALHHTVIAQPVCDWIPRLCRFTRARLQDDLDELTARFQRRGFPAVRVRTDFDPRTSFDRRTKTVALTVTIDPRRKVDVVFEGNDRADFPDDTLAAQLTFGAATSADELEVAASARAIERLYQAAGHLDVMVTSERVRLQTFDRIIYRIEPGPRRRVRAVEFDCAAEDGSATCSLPPGELAGAVTVGVGAAPPTRDNLVADAAALQRLYRSRGFLSAEVTLGLAPRRTGWRSAALTAAELAAEVAPDDVVVRFAVAEGPRTVIDRIEIVFEGGAAGGRFAGDEARIRERLTIHPGDPYLRDQLEAQAQALKDWYWSLGRPRAVVTVGAPVELADPNHVAITFNVEEKQELQLGEVVIRGNFRTREWIIRRQLGLTRGTPLTADLQTRGLRSLRATNLFNAVTFDLVHFEDPRETTVDVVVKVEERHDVWAQPEGELGLSQQNGLFGRVKVVAPNAWGLGMRFDTGVTLGLDYPTFSRKYFLAESNLHLPRWLTLFDTDLAGFYRSQVTARFGDLRSWGGSAAFSLSWERARDERVGGRLRSLAFRYDLRNRSRDEDAIRIAGASGALATNPIATRTGTIGVTLAWDQRQDDKGNLNPLAPSRGFRLEGGAAGAASFLLSQDAFIKLNALGQGFWSHGRFLLRADARYDHGFPLGGAVLLPEVERFFAGGDDTVRGFEEDRLAVEQIVVPVPPLDGGCDPDDPTAGGLCQVRLAPAGGNLRALASLDAQVRLSSLFGIPVASAVFTDAGLVANTWSSVTPGAIRPSAGMALRWLIPIGALSVEYAVPILPKLGDDPRGRFHVAVALRY